MKKYKLLKNILTKDGNMLFARQAYYTEGEIPKEFINPLNVIVVEETQTVVNKQTSNLDETHYLTEPDGKTTLTAKFYDPNTVEVVNKININTLTLEQLKEIKGIGDKTAVQLITNKPYTSVTDLTTKVKPPTGKNWEEFHFMFNEIPTI